MIIQGDGIRPLGNSNSLTPPAKDIQLSETDNKAKEIAKQLINNSDQQSLPSINDRNFTKSYENDLNGVDAVLTQKLGVSDGKTLLPSKPKSKDPLKWADADVHPKFASKELERFLTKAKTGMYSNKEASWILEVSTGNKAFNEFINAHKRAESPLYETNASIMNALSHYSYVTQRADEFNQITAKANQLLKQFEQGEVIDENQKLKPSEMHLIDSFSGSTFFVSGFLKNTLMSIPDDHPLRNSLMEIKESLKHWSDLKKIAMEPYKTGDIMFDTVNLKQYYPQKGLRDQTGRFHVVLEALTGTECYHASIFYNAYNQSTKQFDPRQSHVIGDLCKTPMKTGQLSYVESFRIDPFKLLDEKLLDLEGLSQNELRILFENIQEQVTSEIHDRFGEDSAITNGNLPMLSLFLGHKFDEKKQLEVLNLPERSMACSEFVTYTTLISLNRLEIQLRGYLEGEKDNDSKIKDYLNEKKGKPLLKPLLPTDSPIVIHPGNLYKILMKKGVAERVAPHPKIAAIMQTPKIEDARELALDQETYRKGEFAPAWHWRGILKNTSDFLSSLPTG